MAVVISILALLCMILAYAVHRSWEEYDHLEKIHASRHEHEAKTASLHYQRGHRAGERSGLRKAQDVALSRRKDLSVVKTRALEQGGATGDARSLAYAYWQARVSEAARFVKALGTHRFEDEEGA